MKTNTIKTVITDLAIQKAMSSVEAITGEIGGSVAEERVIEKQVSKTLQQDALVKSKRVWSAVFGVLTAVLLTPTVQLELTKLIGLILDPVYVPLVTSMFSAVLAALSKKSDVRPLRQLGNK